MRKEVALLPCVWEAVRTHLTYQVKNKQEATLGTQNRLVQNSEKGATRAAEEKCVGKLRDKEAVNNALVALKLEQVEDGVPVAEDLRDVTSLEAAIIDPTTADCRFASPPGPSFHYTAELPEELRLRHRRLGLAWSMVATRHLQTVWTAFVSFLIICWVLLLLACAARMGKVPPGLWS